jgi:ABC-type polysaccharide/polyol phosphate export permease
MHRRIGRVQSAIFDVVQGLQLAPIWWRVGLNQLRGRYRRTVLGPFWIAGSLLTTAFALYYVFGTILGAGNNHQTFPHMLAGILIWSLIGASIAEATTIFTSAVGVMQTHRMPLSYHVFLQTDRVVINFLHQLVAFWLVMLLLRLPFGLNWTFVPAFILDLVAIIGMSILVAMISARFKDVAYMIGLMVQVLFFLTPVFWFPANLPPQRRFIVDYNPFAQMLDLLRQPLLGLTPSTYDWVFMFVFTVAVWAAAIAALAIYRRRVVFWV